MNDKIQISSSQKNGINSKESYIVTRGCTSYLRILGCEPQYFLVTATASEDSGHITVCNDQVRLIAAAKKLGKELETNPSVEKDWIGREYISICGIKTDPEQNQDDFEREIEQLLSRFFELFDEYKDIEKRPENEMVEIYHELAIDDFGGDVYLSDGVWLSSDGSLHDRGR